MSSATSNLHCDPATDRLLILTPGQKKPTDPSEIHTAKPGISILVVPKYDFVVTLEVTQLSLKVDIVVSVTMTVRSLKARLQKERGFLMDRTDLLFRDLPMENQRHLFDYRLTHGATIFCMLHLIYDIRVTVETFWGINYDMYVDPCMTTTSLLTAVLRRTVSQQAGNVSSFYNLALPRHALVMYSEDGVPMKWGGCLGKYKLDDGVTFSLSTVALAHQMSVQTIPVIMTKGSKEKTHNFSVSKFDYWSVLALKVHGVTGHPVNLMRFFCGRQELDLARVVGTFKAHKAPPILLDLSLLKLDNDILNGVTFSFRLGNGVVEELTCAPTRTVKSVKAVLEDLGVPNARIYDFFVDGYKLPNNSRIGDVVEEHKKPIILKLRTYPLFVHGPNSVIYKMNVHAQEALKVFKTRVQMKTGLSQSDYYMLMSGLPVTDKDSTPVFQTPLAINCSVFLMATQAGHTFILLCDDVLVKLRLPFYPQASELKNILWKDRNVPEGSLASLANFMQWYFAMRRAGSKGLADDAIKDAGQPYKMPPGRGRARKRLEMPLETALWKTNVKQMRQLQDTLEAKPPRDKLKQRRKWEQRKVQSLPDIGQPRARAKKGEQGVYYATYRHGKWQRVNPEDIADNYLRALSLPPDISNVYPDKHAGHKRRKHHSALPVQHQRAKGRGRKEPEWVYSLQRMAREERVEPALAGMKRRGKHVNKR